jgi:sterol desaturase/sphingolipid hydroxylase (fatty acid hydroxylase superfamily)
MPFAGLNPLPNAVRGLILGAWVAALWWWEHRRALRPVADSKLQRDARNLAVAAPSAAVMQWLEFPVAFGLAMRAKERGTGLVQLLPVPALVRALIAMALLDYTLYLWHVLTHRVPFLWRFHQVHHIDREMDATTALRFHFGEIALSIGFRAAQVWLIGPGPKMVAAWQIFLFVCILFHHANVRIPLAWERRLARLVVTPRLHGIHHSIEPEEVNSNWSSGLTVWDWLHGTLRTERRQDAITIGVPGFRDDAHQRLKAALTLPFEEAGEVPPMPRGAVRQPIDALE